MTAISGVSGSGKSSLVSGILAPALQRHLHNSDTIAGKHSSIKGLEHVDKAIIIDQSPIGRTPRSNPATYTKVFDEIRTLFSKTTLAKERGYKPGHFSFNVKGGRCESCKGAGSMKLEMNFLPDVWITCDVCQGLRYTRECLEVTWKGKNINDILQMPIGEAVTFFENHRKMKPLSFSKITEKYFEHSTLCVPLDFLMCALDSQLPPFQAERPSVSNLQVNYAAHPTNTQFTFSTNQQRGSLSQM